MEETLVEEARWHKLLFKCKGTTCIMTCCCPLAVIFITSVRLKKAGVGFVCAMLFVIAFFLPKPLPRDSVHATNIHSEELDSDKTMTAIIWLSRVSFVGSILLFVFALLLLGYIRNKLRHSRNIGGSFCEDCQVVSFFTCCALCQMFDHLENEAYGSYADTELIRV